MFLSLEDSAKDMVTICFSQFKSQLKTRTSICPLRASDFVYVFRNMAFRSGASGSCCCVIAFGCNLTVWLAFEIFLSVRCITCEVDFLKYLLFAYVVLSVNFHFGFTINIMMLCPFHYMCRKESQVRQLHKLIITFQIS